ncbi:MAG: hypothetical protein AAF358_05895 [Pseudomonadota bacterium]
MRYSAQLRILGLLCIPLLFILIRAPLVNYPLTLLAFGILGIAFVMLWRTNEPPLVMLVVVYQWLQASTKLLHANVLGIPLDDMLVEGSFGAEHPVMGALSEATGLTLIGLLALIAGFAVAQLQFSQRLERVGEAPEAGPVDSDQVRLRLLMATGAAIAVSSVLKSLQYLLPGSVTQIILPLIDLKWAFVFALACQVLRDRRGYGWLIAVCGLEIVLGFAAYFSAWKEVILVLALAYFFCRPSFEFRRVAAGFGIVSIGLVLAVFWTAIKVDQRQFLNRGTGQQVITRSTGESILNAFDLAAATEAEAYRQAVGQLADRIAYVDYFANALIHVPQVRPYENGRLWWRAVTHVFTPRILFPNKPPLPSDSEQTMYYTGLLLASSFEGTSISLGYMAESYIDFGALGMFVPIFLWGYLVVAAISQLIIRYGRSDLVWGAAVVIILNTLILEVAAVKMVGGTLMSIIVLFLLFRFVGGPLTANIYQSRPVAV